MNVKQLKKQLENLDDNLLVVLSSDAEGNSFDILAAVDSDMTYNQGKVSLIEEMQEFGKPCIVLYPYD